MSSLKAITQGGSKNENKPISKGSDMIVKLVEDNGKVKGYSCAMCNKKEKLQKDLKIHIRENHEEEKITDGSESGYIEIEEKDYN